MSRLAEVLDDLAAEGDRLDALVGDLPAGPDGWRAPTPAAGWTVAHQLAHLAWTDEAALAACTDPDAWGRLVDDALADPDHFVDAAAERGAALPGAELLTRWRSGRARLAAALAAAPADTRLAWFGPPMSPTSMATARFMETWAHAHDVADALGAVLEADDRVRHVVHLGVRTRDFSFRNRGLEPPAEPVRVALRLPGGAVVEHGPSDARQSVTGSAQDFALLVTQRRHRSETDLVAEGEDARRWLQVAQAFAGPPGPGRDPR
jgi:uncharacterized protein (TIGR03084 family)